ncbi:MAG TPA: GMC family oxidoreductase [Thermoanaerobaculia bacterium]|nr:GMC family oxidoreductase [Thermoanaerobaculia bacterium]
MYDYIIIGSGFGGAVTACRLAEKGAKVVVLERGRRWELSNYPITDSFLYDAEHPEKFNGWLDFRFFGKMSVAQGAGIGGGSLIYANISCEARKDVFDNGWPPEITYNELKPYYDRVAKFMQVQRVPENQVPARFKLMKEAAEKTGNGARFLPLELCVMFDPEWNYDYFDPLGRDASHSKKFLNDHGVEQGTCVHCGNCDIGCRFGAKSTLDMNYIPVAEKHGADFRPLHVVRVIEPSNGHYKVHFDRIDGHTLKPGSEEAKNVIVAAGSIGSTELLLRNRDQHKTLRNLSAFLGKNWSSNGDFLTPAEYKTYRPYPHRGPTITSAIDFGDGGGNGNSKGQKFWIEDGGYPNLIANFLRGVDLKIAREIANLMESSLDDNVMPWFAQGVDAGNARLYLGRNWWWPFKKHLKMDWDLPSNRAVFDAIYAMHKELSAATDGKPLPMPQWNELGMLVTPHPLGGCNMGTTPQNGVVDHRGEAFGHKGLYVADAAIIPRPIGRNPTRTIAALAERIVERM